MGDRVAVMRKGELQQVAPPQELYDRPANIFVAGFIGSPAMNMLEAEVERGPNGAIARARRHASRARRRRAARLVRRGRTVVVGVRPEELEDAAEVSGAAGRRLRGRVTLREALGAEVLVHFTVAARQAVTEHVRELAEDVGDDRVGQLVEAPQPEATLVGRFHPRMAAVAGDTIEVCVDPRALHLFDRNTGLAIRAA